MAARETRDGLCRSHNAAVPVRAAVRKKRGRSAWSGRMLGLLWAAVRRMRASVRAPAGRAGSDRTRKETCRA